MLLDTAEAVPAEAMAMSGLRAELRHQHLATGARRLIDWATLRVAGPTRQPDAREHL